MNFVFDLDGTLCFNGKPISSKIIKPIQQLNSAGHQIAFASARTVRDMLPVIDPSLHHLSMIGGNGSHGFKQGELLFSFPIPQEALYQIMPLLLEFKAGFLADSHWNYSYQASKSLPIFKNINVFNKASDVPWEELHPIIKILILTVDNPDDLIKNLSSLPVRVTYHSDDHTFDLNSKDTDKWIGLKQIQYEINDYIAFGNDLNDIPLFKNARHSIMIDHNKYLAPYSDESISLTGDFETIIGEKITSFL